MTVLERPPDGRTRQLELPTGMVIIPDGEFQMGSDQSELANQKPARYPYLDTYLMKETPVTNDEYARFVAATGYQTRAEKRGIGPNWLTASVGNRNIHPVVYLTWDDAVAYCNWLSLRTGLLHRLPSEAEWEKAARGGLYDCLYPWGNESPNGYCGWDQPELLATSPIGAFAPNRYGLYDMVGNVWQWCADWYDESYYAGCNSSSWMNPPGPVKGTTKCRRGGAHNVRETFRLTCANRGALEPDEFVPNVGFRPVLTWREDEDFRTKAEAAFLESLRAMTHDNGGAALYVDEGSQAISVQLVGTCRLCPSQTSSAQALARFIKEQLPEASVTCNVLGAEDKKLIQLV